MSISKLESLPNEILIHLLEKYINPIDVFIAFANHLNNRFDKLIDQCKLFHLDLTNVRKKEFDCCISSLFNYRNKIQSLFLSGRLPGQICTFLSLFPTFDQFECLGELYLDFDINRVDENIVDTALHSLSRTKIHTLSIKVDGGFKLFGVKNIHQEFFRVSTIKRLVIDTYLRSIYWNLRNLTVCNIEHLTITGSGCTWTTFKKILACGTRLSYLNVGVTPNVHNSYAPTSDDNFNIQPLIKLHTFIFCCCENALSPDFNLLVPYLYKMPNLRHLEITDEYGKYLDGTAWQILFQTSLPLLNHFALKKQIYSQEDYFSKEMKIRSFDTPFWSTKKNFNIYKITYQTNHRMKVVSFYHPIKIERDQNTVCIWTFPQRPRDNDDSELKTITRLYIKPDFPIPSREYKLNNVKYLHISYLNSFLFNWMIRSIDLSKITQLIIFQIENSLQLIIPLISRMEQLILLSIDFNLLIDQQNEIIGRQNKFVKRLDISSNQHSFQKKNILFIANLFPSIEHLQINTKDLNNVPLLSTYLPNLITLTFTMVGPNFQRIKNYEEWDNLFRRKVKFQYIRNADWITIWLDQNTFDDTYWQSF